MISVESRRKMGWRKGKRFTKFTKSCVVCSKPFETVPTSSKQYCCSRACQFLRRRKWPKEQHCLKCNRAFWARRTKIRFCSRGCSTKTRKLTIRDIRPQLLSSRGERCERCRWDVSAKVLEVHHRDRNPRNNDLHNLLILCPNCHELDHFSHKDGRHRH